MKEKGATDMSTLMVKVCEECGKRSDRADGWLVVSRLDVRSSGTGDRLIDDTDVDLCSQGCLLRHVSRQIESAAHNHAHTRPVQRQAAVVEPEEDQDVRVAYL